MRWLELRVEADVEAVEAVSEILGRVSEGTAVRPTRLLHDPPDELSVRADPAAPFLVTAHIPDDAAARAAIESTEQALWHLQAFGLRPLSSLIVQVTEDANWTDAWREHYPPQRIGRVLVVPSWLPEPSLRDGEVVVRMDPGMAFGTGLHPTTRGCLQLIQELGPLPATVLDVGCGSGILALAALRLGAVRAVACDTDELAVTAARGNAALNDLGERIDVRHGSLAAAAAERFPLVLANLVAALLVELAPLLAAHVSPGGTLLAGGIIQVRAPEVIEALQSAGLRPVARRDDGEWVSLRLERPA
ncbi:MAG: 50S ribosomal protein L11 methyltransferase [Candidatus Limnocylindria bacterium]